MVVLGLLYPSLVQTDPLMQLLGNLSALTPFVFCLPVSEPARLFVRWSKSCKSAGAD